MKKEEVGGQTRKEEPRIVEEIAAPGAVETAVSETSGRRARQRAAPESAAAVEKGSRGEDMEMTEIVLMMDAGTTWVPSG